jgi:hypothetical protein
MNMPLRRFKKIRRDTSTSDDVNLLGDNIDTTKKNTEALSDATQEVVT